MPASRDFRNGAATVLRDAAQAHVEGRFQEIGSAYDRLAKACSQMGCTDDDVGVALDLLDSWHDSSNHDWHFYEPLQRDDWPRLALERAEDLEAQRPINPVLREKFGRAPRQNAWRPA